MPMLITLLAEPLAVLLTAVADGRVDAEEGKLIQRALLEAAADAARAPGIVPDLVEWVGDLLHRDPAELRARAAELELAGKVERAARLRERAARVEARG